MKIYVVVRTDIAPDVRISAGGGEIGSVELESAHYSREEAQHWASVYYEEKRLELKERDSDEEMDTEELNDYMEYLYRWDIEEVKLRESSVSVG